jgi:sporulation protein YlmC with PRC-barrel domain
MKLLEESLRGRAVIAADGQVVGELAALYLESTTLRVEALQVKLRKEIADRLGVERSVFHSGSVEIPLPMVQSVGDTIVLNVAADDLRQLFPGRGAPAPAP